jgi:competence ComEA-like helix-hairpin-helix protein
MLKLKHWIKSFFGFPRSHVNGFIILLILTTLMLFSEPIWHRWTAKSEFDGQADQMKLDSLVALWNSPNDKVVDDSVSTQLFHFNPNTARDEDLVTLGFSHNLATRIIRYREKGGKFRIKSDLLKIYGVDSAFYDRVYPFISLPRRIEKSKLAEKKSETKNVSGVKKVAEKFDLNNADTSQLKKIYGIGEKLSLRIIKYRDRLGGFVRWGQLAEVYGLDSLVIERLIESATIQEDFKPKKININTASEKQLSSHPYLTGVAKAIVSYRFQHGNFENVDAIQNVSVINEKSIQRIIPYLTVNDEL